VGERGGGIVLVLRREVEWKLKEEKRVFVVF
jgi:hypothetical protein